MTHSHEAHQRRIEKLTRECGTAIISALKDEAVIEVMLNADGKLWVDRAGEGMSYTGHDIPPSNAESILATCASMLNTAITYDNPILEGEFPLDGSRLEGLIPPVVSHPVFAIRKPGLGIFTLEQYVEAGIIKPLSQVVKCHSDDSAFAKGFKNPIDALCAAVDLKKNILVVGGTSAGKTKLTTAILHLMSERCPDDRVVVIEETRELQVIQSLIKNALLLKTSDTVNMQRLLRATMRLRPDRIVVGEVRGGEVATLLKAWNSGHPGGIATIHADTAEKGLRKVVSYATEVENTPPHHIICEEVADAVNLVVFIEKINVAPWRQVAEVLVVKGFSNGQFILEPIREIS